jgi:hypothetical protein
MGEEVAGAATQDTALSALTPQTLLGRMFGSEFRLGWVFRDRNQFLRPWARPEPPRAVVDPQLERQARKADARFHDIGAMLVVWGLVGLTVGAAIAPGAGSLVDELWTLVGWTIAFVVGAGTWMAVSVIRHNQVGRQYAEARRGVEEIGSSAWSEWAQARDTHQFEERERVDRLPEWGPVEVSRQLRVDVFGGTLRSWCGLLTTYLTSVVRPGRRVVALDLTGSEIAQEACYLCEREGLSVKRVLLPDGLSNLGLDTDLVDLVVQAIHGADSGGRQDDRMVDMRVLNGICEELRPTVTIARLRDGLRVLLGAPGSRSGLTDEERSRIGGDLFPETYVERAHERIRVLEAYLDQLVVAGPERPKAPGGEGHNLECLMLAQGARMAVTDLATRAAAHWLITAARGGSAAAEVPRVIVIAGADRVPGDLLDWLWRACEQHGIQLVAMFQHLRDEPARFIGGGRAVAFMRLGNHSEAESAANFIGREHRFELSQLTKSLGGGSSETAGTHSGAGESQSVHNALGVIFDIPLTRADTFSTNWGSSQSFAESTNWHSDEAQQRVYEHRVEPSELQGLPEHAMLLVTHQVGGPRLLAVECSPDILTLPRVSSKPLTLNTADQSGGLRQLLGDRVGGGE